MPFCFCPCLYFLQQTLSDNEVQANFKDLIRFRHPFPGPEVGAITATAVRHPSHSPQENRCSSQCPISHGLPLSSSPVLFWVDMLNIGQENVKLITPEAPVIGRLLSQTDFDYIFDPVFRAAVSRLPQTGSVHPNSQSSCSIVL